MLMSLSEQNSKYDSFSVKPQQVVIWLELDTIKKNGSWLHAGGRRRDPDFVMWGETSCICLDQRRTKSIPAASPDEPAVVV